MSYDLTTFSLVFTFIGTLVIGFAKYYERKMEGSTEQWDNTKFGVFFLVAAGIMLFEYLYVGKMQFPADDIINTVITLSTPIASLFGLTYTVILGGKYVKNGVVIPVVSSIQAKAAEKAAAAPMETNWLAISVTPTYKAGKSPLAVVFSIYATQPTSDHPGISSVDIDFADGNKTNVTMVNGQGSASHIYTFTKTEEYTGHTFYPVFKCNGSDGSTYLFNAGERKSVEIWVEAA